MDTNNLDNILSHIPACAIEWSKAGSDFGHKLVAPEPCRIEEESHGTMVTFSAENADGIADYWRDLYIHSELEAWADKFGAYFEWESAGAISVLFEGVRS